MISVLMACYREKEVWLCEAIDSIRSQTEQDWELIIIQDDPDNKEHAKILNAYVKKDSRIKWFPNSENQGLTASLNRALKLAKGEYIARMDADDVSLPHRFKRQIQYLEEKEYDLIGGYTQFIDENGTRGFLVTSIPKEHWQIEKRVRYNNCIPHPAWFGRRTLFEQLNGYREIPHCEDYDFTLRALKAGAKLGNIPELILYYRNTKGSISRSNLLPQFLYGKADYKAVMKGKPLVEAIREADHRCTPNACRHYNQSNAYMTQALEDLEKKHYLYACKSLLKAFFGSKYFAKKMIGLFAAGL